MAIIYTLSDPETKEIRYVGKTSGLLTKRLYEHQHKRTQTPVSFGISRENVGLISRGERWTHVSPSKEMEKVNAENAPFEHFDLGLW